MSASNFATYVGINADSLAFEQALGSTCLAGSWGTGGPGDAE